MKLLNIDGMVLYEWVRGIAEAWTAISCFTGRELGVAMETLSHQHFQSLAFNSGLYFILSLICLNDDWMVYM